MRNLMLSAVLSLILAAPAQAVYPEDYMNKLSEDERSAYLFGALEMAMTVYESEGKEYVANCLKDWWINHLDDANHAFWEKMREPVSADYSAAASLDIVIRKHCEK